MRMNIIFCATASTLLFAALESPGALAQPGSAAQQQRQSQATTTSLEKQLNGLNLGPMLMSFNGAGGVMTDFTHSNEFTLLQRSDVRSELFIDSKQREELEQLDQVGSQQLQRTMVQTLIRNTANNPDLKQLAQHSKNGTPDAGAIADVLNSSFETMQGDLRLAQSDLDLKERALLNSKQKTRLRELDLQWRGLLSLSDKKVADELKVTPEQKTAAEAALKAYQTTQTNVLLPIMTSEVRVGEQAEANRRRGLAYDPQEVQHALANAMDSDTMRQARATAEAKVKAALTPAQLDQWKTMTGRKFYFERLDQ